MRGRPSHQSGFSLVELLIAMTVVLIVGGAIFGLLTSGQSAFRRQPELTDRQQSIRVAMDVVMRDVSTAGDGMPEFIQTFSPGLNACSGCPDGGAPMGSAGEITDELEILSNPGAFEPEPTCHYPGQNAAVLRMRAKSSKAQIKVPVLVFFKNGTWTIRNPMDFAVNKTGAGDCESNEEHAQMNVKSGGDTTGFNTAGGLCPEGVGTVSENTANCKDADCALATGGPWGQPSNKVPERCCCPTSIGLGELVRYRVRNGTDGMPNLQRFSSGAGTLSATATYLGYQDLARGIDDLQVQYVRADGAASDNAPVTMENDCRTVITQVRVTLSSRAETLRGTTSPVGNAVRGRLTSVGAPRNALFVASLPTTPGSTPNCSAGAVRTWR